MCHFSHGNRNMVGEIATLLPNEEKWSSWKAWKSAGAVGLFFAIPVKGLREVFFLADENPCGACKATLVLGYRLYPR